MSAGKVHASERTGNRIRAYLTSLVMRGETGNPAVYRQGADAISRLITDADTWDAPEYRLSAAEAKAVLLFIRDSTPINASDWWEDPEGAPSRVCGLHFVLDAVAEALPGGGQPPNGSPTGIDITEPKAPTGSARHPDTKLATLLHRLELASYKLDLVAEHYSPPGKCSEEHIGAIAITRDVARELDSLFPDFAEWAHDKGLIQNGPLVDSWDTEEALAPGAEAQ